MRTEIKEEAASGWRHRIHEVVFESDTPAGRAFDVTVISLILISVAAVVLESYGVFAKSSDRSFCSSNGH